MWNDTWENFRFSAPGVVFPMSDPNWVYTLVKTMETRYEETNLLWPYFTKHEMEFSQVLS